MVLTVFVFDWKNLRVNSYEVNLFCSKDWCKSLSYWFVFSKRFDWSSKNISLSCTLLKAVVMLALGLPEFHLCLAWRMISWECFRSFSDRNVVGCQKSSLHQFCQGRFIFEVSGTFLIFYYSNLNVSVCDFTVHFVDE